MQRWHRESKIAYRQQQRYLKFNRSLRQSIQKTIESLLITAKTELGRFRKHHAFDCGQKRCQICHFDKIHKIPTRQEKRADLHFQEGLVEIEHVTD